MSLNAALVFVGLGLIILGSAIVTTSAAEGGGFLIVGAGCLVAAAWRAIRAARSSEARAVTKHPRRT